jgi:hypothetical protein
MSRAQRLTFLGIAAIIAVVSVIVLGGGEDQTERAARTPAPAAGATSRTTSSRT